MDVKSLYIIVKSSGVCLYHKDFRDPIFDPHLISSFIVAMTQFFEESNQSLESAARAFEGSDYKIVVEFGEWTVGALVVSEDREYLREKLQNVIKVFEEKFSILKYVDMDLAVYSRFEPTVLSEFILEHITPETIIRKKLRWETIAKHPDVREFLEHLPDKCSVKKAAEINNIPVELAIARTADAVWEKAVSTLQPVRPDDIYQATSIARVSADLDGVSPSTARAIAELDGETTLAVAAERANVPDFEKFMEEIALLAQRKAIEKVPPAQATLILQASVLQALLNTGAKIIGVDKVRKIYIETKINIIKRYPWIAFVDLEDGVDVEVRSSLIAASVKGAVSPITLYEGFKDFMQSITKNISHYTGIKPTNCMIGRVKSVIERQFPNRSYEVEWEYLTTSP